MWTLNPIEFSELSGWAVDNIDEALLAYANQALKPAQEQYRCGSLGLQPQWFEKTIFAAQASEARSNSRAFFEQNFQPFKLSNGEKHQGKVTGFYEPEVDARLVRTDGFTVPLLKRPNDLVALNEANRPDELDEQYRFGRQLPSGEITEYFDRTAINSGALEGLDLEIAFVENPVDAFFIHIQGAARLKLPDNEVIRVTFDGKSGHPFTAIGRLLVERGHIAKTDISMQSIRVWLKENPSKANALMEENRSYIFFKQSNDTDLDLGPIAAAKVPLLPMRSLAVDRLLHTFSTPIFVNAKSVNGKPFDHLMIAQETGTAIVGPARGDIFFGSGQHAGEFAGAVNSPCDFTVLVPKDAQFDFESVRLP